MTGVAGLSALVDRRAHFRRGSGITDFSLRIHDAHPHHTRLIRHVQHHLVEADAVVVEHVARGAAAQHFTLLFGADQGGVFQMFPLALNAEVAEKAEDDDQHEENQTISFALMLRPSRFSNLGRGERASDFGSEEAEPSCQSPAWAGTAISLIMACEL